MAGNPKTSKSTAPGYGRMKASSPGVRSGVNPKATAQSTATMKKGGMVGKTAPLSKSSYKMGGKVGKKK
jgi:hypothetical protein